VAKRIASGKNGWDEEPVLEKQEGEFVLDEVTEVIDLPGFSNRKPQDTEAIEIPREAELQLRAYVSAVANAYHRNPFHCLQHASAVTMALTKLLSRIVINELDDIQEEGEGFSDSESDNEAEVTESIASHLHNHTFGITSDPLTQFAVVLSGFIHAVDHAGLPNSELAKEDPEGAAAYKNRSIIEQRSVDKAWKKLMEPAFCDLRKCIYADGIELKRFRQVVINSVLATDLEDEELQTLRMKRWEKTFSRGAVGATLEDVNRKATIVIEHLMQASDIFHTMQPWIVYEKWSTREFEELHVAFKNGRSKVDPSVTWYQNEVEFFDNYVIPLALQLKDCDAFVVSSDEYLIYALKNRQQLATKGKEMTSVMLAKIDGGKVKDSPTTTEEEPSARTIFNSETIKREEQDIKVTKHVQRLVDWNVEMLQRLLTQVVAKRNALGKKDSESDLPVLQKGNILDEVAEVIAFPSYDPSSSPDKLNPDSVELGVAAESQLRDYVTDVSSRFKDNPFHGLDRGSQVCMTTKKMMSRIATSATDPSENLALDLHNRTFGISSDPLAQFAIVFAALVHDVDHQGVPNSQLVRENSYLADKYKHRSISEQHSIDLAWSHLMQPDFADLRACIYSDETELKRFHQVVVNAVLATDCIDEELVALRQQRWEKGFVKGRNDSSVENVNRKATIVIEMLMQSSDIFHATQNWHLYHKWNERHFQEMYKAFKQGRLAQDPSIFWYKSEVLFFDEHVIPIAKQISECGVFDATGDEHLSFALANRQQWAAKGGDLVASMVAKYHGKEIEKTRTKRAYRRMSLSAKSA
jgi:hypothetical protein